MMPTRPLIVHVILDVELSPTERLLLAYLAWRQGANGEAWPSQRTIAKDLGLTCDGVRKIVRRLEAKGKLCVNRPQGGGRGRRIQYTVTTAKPPTAIDPLETEKPPTTDEGLPEETPDSQPKKPPTAKPRHIRRTLQGTQQSKKRTSAKTFTPPTSREVEEYAESLGYTNFHKGQAFIDCYAPRGWRDTKGRPVRDWKAKLRNVRLKDLKKPQRGDPDWLPTEEEANAIYEECANTN